MVLKYFFKEWIVNLKLKKFFMKDCFCYCELYLYSGFEEENDNVYLFFILFFDLMGNL